MDLRDWFYRQRVSEVELAEGFELAEAADRAIMRDAGIVGVCSGGTASANGATLSVDLTAGVVYDQLGQRIAWDGTENVDVSRDTSGAVTNVVTPGNERWVSIFAVFNRLAGNARVDGNGDEVLYDQDESYTFRVLQGAEAAIGAATRPSLQGDAILLCDVQLEQGQTLLAGGDISLTRRQWAFAVGAGFGTAEEAIASLFASPVSTFTAGLVVEEANDEVAILGTSDRPSSGKYKLLLQAPVNDSGTVVYARMYAVDGAGGGGLGSFCLTINARRNNSLDRWEADSSAVGAAEWSVGIPAVGASFMMLRGRASGAANWTSWTYETAIQSPEGILEGAGTTTTYAGWQGTSGPSTAGYVGVGVPFRKRFPGVPGGLSFTVESTDNITGFPVVISATVDGARVRALATAVSTETFFFGTVQAG